VADHHDVEPRLSRSSRDEIVDRVLEPVGPEDGSSKKQNIARIEGLARRVRPSLHAAADLIWVES